MTGPLSPGLAWLDGLGPQRIRPGLTRTRALLDALGRPQASYRSILIGGTNGKGSAAATAAAVLQAAGVRTGLYTSPHLVRVNERIRLLERDVDDRRLDEVLSLLAAISSRPDPPTYFEALTVAAFELFERARVEVAVVEVGLGGRLDATNVLSPDVSVVTNVGRDHLDVLGPTLADVAREKAGIFRAGRPAFTAAPAHPMLRQEAERIGARLVEVAPTDRTSPLAGRHQRTNLALALAAVNALVAVPEETLAKGVAATRWPGRLQRVARPGRRDLLLDGAHNVDGAAALAAYLVESGLSGEVDLVFGGLADKELPAMLATLAPLVRRIVLTAPESPRAEAPELLAARLGRPELPCASDVASAIALLECGGAAPILVTGSLVLVGEALRIHSGGA